jgi:hypothetical protein
LLNKRRIPRYLAFLLAIFALAILQAQSVPPRFAESELSFLKQGKLVERLVKMEGEPWPQTTYYFLIDMPPLDAFSLYSDVEAHPSFAPDILEKRIINRISPTEFHVGSTVKVPWPLNQLYYETGNVLETYGKDGYCLRWYLVSSEQSENVRGFCRFEPFEGRTLMIYRSHITPKSIFAPLFQGRVVKDSRKAVYSVYNYLQNQHFPSTFVETRRKVVQSALRR